MNVLRRSLQRAAVLVAALSVPLTALAVTAAPATAAVGDEVIAWLEVEDGVISGGPALNSGDHGNFSGTGSYTFRETGMQSTMTVNAPAAGTYPVYIRYAAGPLTPEENVTRAMGLLTNGGSRQQVSYPITSLENWEAWRFSTATVTLNQGPNTIAVQCDRGQEICRLNFDAIQVGGTAPDPCPATAPEAGWTSLFDGTFATFDGWRKAGAGGFGRQTDCTIRGFRGRGATWLTTQQQGPYTLELDWRRGDADAVSSVYVASGSRGGADPAGGFRIPIGPSTGAIVPTGGTAKPADAEKVAAALKPVVGQWNTYSIRLTGSRVRVHLNGTLVNTLDLPEPVSTAGFIGLENPAGSDHVSFRAIRLKPDVDVAQVAAPFTRATRANGATVNPGGESTLGHLVADVQKWATGDTQLALVRPGSLGGDLAGGATSFPAVLTYQQAAAAQPSSDTLVTLSLTGTQLKAVLEQQWQRSAGGGIPSVPFLRLGTSAGFTSTHDPSAPEGSRITGMWLDGEPISPTASYSVAVDSTLAAGGDNFRAFLGATDKQDTGTPVLEALLGYLDEHADPAAGGSPLVPGRAQHAVGVTIPGGAPASYPLGGALAVDLSSLAFPSTADLKDSSVAVSLGGKRLASFPVDNTVGNAVSDEYGTAAVRATVPADAPLGATTLRIVGNKTGTTVELPITVSAASSTTSVRIAPSAVAVRRGTAGVTVTVASAGPTPTGTVELLVGGVKRANLTLVGGRATGTVGPFTAVGSQTVTARYLGSAATLPSTSAATRLTVRKAVVKVTAKVAPAKVVARKTRAKVTVTVTAPGLTPSGRVTVKVGAKTYPATLKGGRATVRLARLTKPGTVRATVSYLGDALTEKAATTAKIKVVRAKR